MFADPDNAGVRANTTACVRGFQYRSIKRPLDLDPERHFEPMKSDRAEVILGVTRKSLSTFTDSENLGVSR
jgi:hypothetical protein